MIDLNSPFLMPDGRTISREWAAYLSTLAAQNNVVVTFNGRSGTVRLGASDVDAALGFTPANQATAAPLASPAFTGMPTAPTAAPGTNTTQLATTAFVKAALPTIGAWQTPALLNGWVNYGTPFGNAAYCVNTLGIVRLRGLVKSGTVGGTTPVFVLPTGFIPPNQMIFPVSTNNTIGRLDIDASGNVMVMAGSNVYVSLDGIAFRNT